jgi:hypothetical protein
MNSVIGVWCPPGAPLLAAVKDQALVRLTLRRVHAAGLLTFTLVPWVRELDHLVLELRSWHCQVMRTHPDERIAMRDLVARHKADIGVVVQGACAVIDTDEIHLAIARIEHGVGDDGHVGRYVSPRLKAFRAADWLRANDSEEWPEPTSTAAAALKFYGTHDQEKASAREVWASLRGSTGAPR